MHAYLIDGVKQTLESVEISSKKDIVKLVGQDTIIFDEIDESDAVYFDEDCFIRGTSGRFQIDSLAPIAGKAVVIGFLDGEQITNVTGEHDGVLARIKFL
ncbi:MAG: hypothetical protein ABJK20_13015 [Halieaceae bacterium]